VPIIAKIYAESYPDVTEKIVKISEILTQEEEKFSKTLFKALNEFERFLEHKFGNVATADKKAFVIPADAFRFYESWGWPVEIFVEEALNRKISLQPEKVSDFLSEFEQEKKLHSEKSRSASAGMFKGGLQDDSVITVKYHTATHLLQAALRKVLGTHVQQKGSNITKNRLRFDFSHNAAVTSEQREAIMKQINEWIAADLPVHRQVMSKQQALESGAIAFFIEKYPDEVSVYTIGIDPVSNWISKELCGGPHVAHTSEIGQLAWQKEQAVAAGIRRIYLA
jgi:alanyl-tRNA synthetase